MGLARLIKPEDRAELDAIKAAIDEGIAEREAAEAAEHAANLREFLDAVENGDAEWLAHLLRRYGAVLTH